VKIEGWLLASGFFFFTLVGAVYGYLSRDVVGTVLLIFTAFLALIAGYYILYTSKRVYPRPEDRMNAEIDEADKEDEAQAETIKQSTPDYVPDGATIISNGTTYTKGQQQNENI